MGYQIQKKNGLKSQGYNLFRSGYIAFYTKLVFECFLKILLTNNVVLSSFVILLDLDMLVLMQNLCLYDF